MLFCFNAWIFCTRNLSDFNPASAKIWHYETLPIIILPVTTVLLLPVTTITLLLPVPTWPLVKSHQLSNNNWSWILTGGQSEEEFNGYFRFFQNIFMHHYAIGMFFVKAKITVLHKHVHLPHTFLWWSTRKLTDINQYLACNVKYQ